MKLARQLIILITAAMVPASTGSACTSLIVTRGASTDSSVMITYTCDGEFHPHIEYTPAADYEAGDSLAITDWSGNVRGYIDQVEHTYAVVDLMNEHQLAIGETTFDGHSELRDPDGILHYWDLMNLALQRAKTAREAIEVMTSLVKEYGYGSTGESFSIADTREAWIMEMIGKGPDKKGAVWVALKVPDGYISAHANKARIGEFPLDDPDNCLYSEDVIDFAIEAGYYDPETDGPFRFCDVYCPPTVKNRRWAEMRVWSLFRRAAPSKNLTDAFHRSEEGAEPYPLWIKPDEKISVAGVFDLMRDHYEGTPYDMAQGIDAGPYNTPYRWRPLHWTVDDTTVEYAWERPISTQQTGFSFVSQSRDWLPDPIGGVYWYGVDDTWFTVYNPLYCGIDGIPPSYARGSLQKFSWESAWWVFNFVSNIANLRYSAMIEDIQAVQGDLESQYLALQPAVEKTAVELYDKDPGTGQKYLTDYSILHAENAVRRWKELGENLLVKYNDGYIKDEKGQPQQVGYPVEWLRRVVGERPDQFRLPSEKETEGTKLID